MSHPLILDPDKKILKGKKYFVYLDGLYLQIILEAISSMKCKFCHFFDECSVDDNLCINVRNAIIQILDKQAGIEELKPEDIIA